MAYLFADPGGGATQDAASFWPVNPIGTVTYDTSLGHNALKFTVNSSRRVTALSDAGRRIHFNYNFGSLPSVQALIADIKQALGGLDICDFFMETTGKLTIQPVGATVAHGNTVLSTNTDYDIAISYFITSATVFKFALFINGVLEVTATAGTLTNVGTSDLLLVNDATFSAPAFFWNVTVDDGSDCSWPGSLVCVAKRPNANGTTNGFVTQIGSGGSGYGSGHAPQVNERPLSQTNGWSKVGAGVATTEEYNVEDIKTGDADLTDQELVDAVGWVFAKSLAGETAQIIVRGVQSAISLTSTPTAFFKGAGVPEYPLGTGSDIGIVTDTTLTTVSLYECGIIMIYKLRTWNWKRIANSQNTTNNLNTHPFTIQLGAAIKKGNRIVVLIAVTRGSSTAPTIDSVADDSGGANVYGADGPGQAWSNGTTRGFVQKWSALAAADATPTITINWTGNGGAGAIVVAYTWLSTSISSHLDVSASTHDDTGTSTLPLSGNTSATARANQLVLGGFADDGSAVTFRPGTNQVLVASIASGNVDMAITEADGGAAGVQAAGGSLSGTATWAMIATSYRRFDDRFILHS